jgi:intracellular sulfur oxidation DsrE/DsrF family protein
MVWLVALFMGLLGVTAAAQAADNAAALGAGRTMKAIYDVNVGKAEKLSLYLRVIAQTVTDVEGQGLRPDFVVALRGSAVRLVSSDKGLFDEAEHEKLGLVATQVAELQKRGVRFEACSIATDLFGVDNGSLLPGVQAVGNTFVSLVGYQTQGYALVPIL